MLYGSDCDDELSLQMTVLAEEHDEQIRVRFDDVTASQTLASPLQKGERPAQKKGSLYAQLHMHASYIAYV